MNIQYTRLFKNIFLIKIPDLIWSELLFFEHECDLIRKNPLSALKQHDNEGVNDYQVSIPNKIFEESYTFPFIIRSCATIFDMGHRKLAIRENSGHFDLYDFWINYAKKGSYNPAHTHAGDLSGVIYIKNDHEEPTIFPEFNIQNNGAPQTMLVFPSNVLHEVKLKETEDERITMAFNLIKI